MMMPNDENPNCIAEDSKQKMIREPPEVYSVEITFPDRKRFRRVRGFDQKKAKLGVKLVS